MLRNFEQQLPPTFQLSKTQNLNLSFYLKFKEVWLFYNITLKSYRNKNIVAGLAIEESDLDLLPIERLPRRHVTSRYALGRRIVSTSSTLLHVDLVEVVDTSSRHCVNIFLRLIDQESIRVHNFNFEIVFFLKLISSNLHSNCIQLVQEESYCQFQFTVFSKPTNF